MLITNTSYGAESLTTGDVNVKSRSVSETFVDVLVASLTSLWVTGVAITFCHSPRSPPPLVY
jgi:hypothetical protein